MGRVKARMELITSKKKCDTTFQVRSKGIRKKAYELSTLCGIKVGMIISNSSGQMINAEMWPKNEQEDGTKMLHDLIAGYKNQELVQRKKRSFNSSHFLKETRKSIPDMSEQELQDFNALLDMQIKTANNRIQYLKEDITSQPVTSTPEPVTSTLVVYDDLDQLLEQMLESTTSQQFSPTKGFGVDFNPYMKDDDITCWINDDDDDVAYNFTKPTVTDCYLQQPTDMMVMPMMMIDPSQGDFGTPWTQNLPSFGQYPTHMMPPMMTITDSPMAHSLSVKENS